jgi:hypothetical protein
MMMHDDRELVIRMSMEFVTLSLTEKENQKLMEIIQKVINFGPKGCSDFLASLISVIGFIAEDLRTGDNSKNQVLIDDICSRMRAGRNLRWKKDK